MGRPGQFQPGKSGNPGGRPKGTPSITARLIELLNMPACRIDYGSTHRDFLAAKILENARAGDFKYVQEVWCRLEGKIPQPVTGKTELALTVADAMSVCDQIERAIGANGEPTTEEA